MTDQSGGPGAPGDALKPFEDAVVAGVSAAEQAAAWQPQLASGLYGADPKFAKAYGLGRQLSTLSQTP